MKKNILIYYQNNKRTIFIESLVEEFLKKGHKVSFLSFAPKGILHDKMKSYGAEVYSNNIEVNRFPKFEFSQLRYLIRFCYKNKIDIIYSHLQKANLVALLAQPFVRAKVVPCRHHADYALEYGNKNAGRLDKLVTFFSKKIVVVSNAAKKFMIKNEKANPKKIEVINLGYNFNLYSSPNLLRIEQLKKRYNGHLKLVMVSRMIKSKRHLLVFRLIKRLVEENFDICLIVLDDGPEKENLLNYVEINKLEKNIHFTGYVDSILDYIAISDFLIHPSISESSNQVVKEAAILGKTVIACKGVGDFDEYLVNGKNSFFITNEDVEIKMFEIIKEVYSNKNCLTEKGVSLKKEVEKRFEIKKVATQYLALGG